MARSSSPPRTVLRGLGARLFAAVIGASVAVVLIVAMQLPLLHQTSRVSITLYPSRLTSLKASLAWPAAGSAALDIPALGVLKSIHDHVVPIASLTKMMTAYVVLAHLPLGVGQSGTCHVVNASDVATYQQMAAVNESSVVVVAGEQLCENVLLSGLLVHSAGNYAVILANMVAGSTAAFVELMNHEALVLGLGGTHYVGVAGLSSGSVSTALDQVKLAVQLMKSPLVRSIVIQARVNLPIAGFVASFTPLVGVDNVIGVKSGRTGAAGGCDVMAMTFRDGTTTRVVYVAVLSQRGGNLLGPAGAAALALATSAVAQPAHVVFAKDHSLGTLSWQGHRIGVGLAGRREIWWWPVQGALRMAVRRERVVSSVRRGEVVGELVVWGISRHVFHLRALAKVSPPSLLQRLR